MNAVRKIRSRRAARFILAVSQLSLGLALLAARAPRAAAAEAAKPSTVHVKLSEWKVTLDPAKVPPGPVILDVMNTGKIPHALEIECKGVEKSTSRIAPGSHATLTVDLRGGTYEAYCPVGKGSHKMLGMSSRLSVEEAAEADEKEEYEHPASDGHAGMPGMPDMGEEPSGHEARAMTIVGGGPVIQILPGPFPFADSAMVVIQTRPEDQKADLTKKAHMGPYSNNVAKIEGNVAITAIDRGASGDSVSGVASVTSQDGARWKVVMDRVQTKDIPYNPRFGGVIMGLFYHGASGVHTPLVPTIQSSVALWAFAHLYRNDSLVTDNAMVHVMLLSRTRRTSDWALDCWDCSDRPVEELQLQVTSAPNTPALPAPGGFLFVNWEKSSGRAGSL